MSHAQETQVLIKCRQRVPLWEKYCAVVSEVLRSQTREKHWKKCEGVKTGTELKRSLERKRKKLVTSDSKDLHGEQGECLTSGCATASFDLDERRKNFLELE